MMDFPPKTEKAVYQFMRAWVLGEMPRCPTEIRERILRIVRVAIEEAHENQSADDGK